MRVAWQVCAVVAWAFVQACSGPGNVEATSRYVDDANYGEGGGTTSGLPCDVAGVLASCTSCHGKPPTSGTPMSLTSWEDLTAASAVDAKQTNAQRAIVRMQDPSTPMPPAPARRATAADIATLQAWVTAGMPKGTCGGGPDPWSAPPVCTSGKLWPASLDDGKELMHPGVGCIGCHKRKGKAPDVRLAGTVYRTAHEPDECRSFVAGAKVVVTDAKGTVVELPVTANGNFLYDQDPLVFPYSAKVVFEGRERVMVGQQSDGDCNGCHTQTGAKDAPGRILLP